MQRFKIGFIGGHGHHYLRQLFVADTEMQFEAAVASDGHDVEASRRFFESLNGKTAGPVRWYDRGEVMLDEFRPDLVSVGSVYGFNGDWNAAALERDIPVVSDKPIAASRPQLQRLETLIAQNPSRVLLTEFDFRCRAEFRAAKLAVEAGLIGDVALVTAQKSYRFNTRPAWYADRASYGGTLLWIASHAIDVITFATGKTFESFTGTGGNVSQPAMGSMEDHVALLGTLSGGASAIVHADYLRPKAAPNHGDDRLRVAGSKGIVEVRDGRAILMTHDQPPTDITDRCTAAVSVGQDLFNAAMRGETTFFSTQQSIHAAKVLLRARDAADHRQWLSTGE